MFRTAAAAALFLLAVPASSSAALFISPAGEPFRSPEGGAAALKAWFDGADADKDGKLTFAEFLADHNRFFAVADDNKNEILAGIDVTVYEQDLVPEILGPEGPGRNLRINQDKLDSMRLAGERPKVLSAESRTGAGLFGLLNEPQPIRVADRDMDFRVTREEWAKAARDRFDRLDTNKDAALTVAELEPRLP